MDNQADTEDRENLQFYAGLVQSETKKLTELMQPFLRSENGASSAAMEQMLRLLGELSARVNVIEQAAEQQLLSENPLAAGPLLFGNLKLPANEIDDESLLPPEWDDEGRVFRWTTKPELIIKLPLFRTGKQRLHVYFKSIIKSDYAKRLKIMVDGETVPHRVKNTDKGLCLLCGLPEASDLAMTELKLMLPAVHSPAELGASDDQRTLGIAIREIVVSKGSASVIQRLRGH